MDGSALLAERCRYFAREAIDVFGGSYVVRAMSKREVAALKPGDEQQIEKIVAWCLLDDSGSPVFTEKQLKEIAELPFTELTRIQEVAVRLTGLSADDAKKNSTSQKSDAGTTSLP